MIAEKELRRKIYGDFEVRIVKNINSGVETLPTNLFQSFKNGFIKFKLSPLNFISLSPYLTKTLQIFRQLNNRHITIYFPIVNHFKKTLNSPTTVSQTLLNLISLRSTFSLRNVKEREVKGMSERQHF